MTTQATPTPPAQVKDDSRLIMKAYWAWAASVWMVVFGAFHAYWGLGGRLLLPDSLRISDNVVLLAINLLAIPLCAVGALVAASFVTSAGQRIPHRWRLTAGWGIAALTLVHSVPTLLLVLANAVGIAHITWSPETKLSYLVYEPWWFLGGLLFLAATEGFRRRSAQHLAS